MEARFVGETDLFQTHRESGDAAAKMFANQGLHDAARGFGLAHEWAAQYLAQAPVMVFAASSGGSLRVSAIYMQHRIASMCAAGVKLKELMAHLRMPLPLRKLTAWALTPTHAATIRSLCDVSPAVLGRIVPEKPRAQREWLNALVRWSDGLGRRGAICSPAIFAWAAEQMATHKVKANDASDMADFVAACSRQFEGGPRFSTDWGWPRATEEMQLWHDRLTCEQMLRGTPFTAVSEIDTGHHADATWAEHRFVALRTPSAISGEGAAMRHCVASYIPRVIQGDCHIVSVLRDGERVATLELSRTWAVRQIKGRFNKAPTQLTQSAAMLYAEMTKDRLAGESKRR